MTRRGLAVVVGLSAIASSLPRAAHASPAARLIYARGPGAESCPDESALRRAVAARVGYDPFFPWAPLTISVELTADEGHLRGRVVFETGGVESGSQTIDAARRQGAGASCEDLLASIALAVSVALDASAAQPAAQSGAPDAVGDVAPPGPPVPAPAATLAPAPAPVSAPGSKPPAPDRPSNTHRQWTPALWLAPGARVSVGAWPTVSAAPELLIELRAGWLGLGFDARYDAPATITVGPDEQASIERATGSVVPCAHFAWVSPCLLATYGETWARGVNVQGGTTAAARYLAFGARAGVELKLAQRFRLLGTLDVVGIATPTHVAVGSNAASSGPVEASTGIALLVSIF